MMPKISVIIPTYNRAQLIGRAILSVLAQTYKDFELVIVDDGSTDNTEEIVGSFDDTRIKFIRQNENKGAAAAKNIGIKIAQSEFIAFQDSDDECMPEKLEKQIKVFQKNKHKKLGVVYSTFMDIKGDKTSYCRPKTITPKEGIVYKKAFNELLRNIGGATALIKKECFEKAGLFDERFPRWEDLEFFIRASKYYYFYHIDEALYIRHVTADSMSSNKKNLITAKKLLLEKFSGEYKKRENRKMMADYLYDIGYFEYLRGETENGREYLLKSIKIHPFNFKVLMAFLHSLKRGN
jgi:glycosyltransferase involved in cell wall biosynthesis